MRLRYIWNSVKLMVLFGDCSEVKEIVLNFLQGVWPFSRWDFTEAAHTRKRILKQLADTREEFYKSLVAENEHIKPTQPQK